jgi:hypothetical protein
MGSPNQKQQKKHPNIVIRCIYAMSPTYNDTPSNTSPSAALLLAAVNHTSARHNAGHQHKVCKRKRLLSASHVQYIASINKWHLVLISSFAEAAWFQKV